ncbi:hypothetical protein KM043_004542 [Ampulex compressa]|nr:hypothetical protein KM043_004542 [Ampulex compressa]
MQEPRGIKSFAIVGFSKGPGLDPRPFRRSAGLGLTWAEGGPAEVQRDVARMARHREVFEERRFVDGNPNRGSATTSPPCRNFNKFALCRKPEGARGWLEGGEGESWAGPVIESSLPRPCP